MKKKRLSIKAEAKLESAVFLKMAATSKAFAFVNEDKVEYSLKDIKSKRK